MNMNLTWPLWIVLIAVSFAALEGYALATKRSTLSRFVWNISKAWPPFGWVCGVLVGFLACHFWWPAMGCIITGF